MSSGGQLNLCDDVEFFTECWICPMLLVLESIQRLAKRFKVVNAIVYLRNVLQIDTETLDVRYNRVTGSWHFTDCPLYRELSSSVCLCERGFQDPAWKMCEEYGFPREKHPMLVKVRNDILSSSSSFPSVVEDHDHHLHRTVSKDILDSHRYFGFREDSLFAERIRVHQPPLLLPPPYEDEGYLEWIRDHLVVRLRHLLMVKVIRESELFFLKPRLLMDGVWHLGQCSSSDRTDKQCMCPTAFDYPKAWVYQFYGKKNCTMNADELSYAVISA